MPQNVNSKTPDKKKAPSALTAAQPLPDTPVAGGTVALAIGAGQASFTAYLAGVFSLGSVVIAEGSLDPSPSTTAWFPVDVTLVATLASGSRAPSSPLLTGGAPVAVRGCCSSFAQVRVRARDLSAGDNITVTLRSSIAQPPVVVIPPQDADEGDTFGVPRRRAPGEVIHSVDPTALTAGTLYTTQPFGVEEFTEAYFTVYLVGTPGSGPGGFVLNYTRMTPGVNGDPTWGPHPDNSASYQPAFAAPNANSGILGTKDFYRGLGSTGRISFGPTGAPWVGSGLLLKITMVGKG